MTAVLRWTSTVIPSAPETQGLPMLRATTAAWEVLPPRLVRIPREAKKPWMSSGLVSSRTRITFSPALPRLAARSASKTIRPPAAPGEAGRPWARTGALWEASSRGCRSCSSMEGLILRRASSRDRMPWAVISTDVRTMAAAFILPFRVCRQ
ncbi:MAG: hypothetical protein BWY88_01429 [Synergistetes bacterium ADurb.Bin520]|nr:MAG: hypothetical protein BWY88_01429 [Synergistetes bacterium ADurb.Bin520]